MDLFVFVVLPALVLLGAWALVVQHERRGAALKARLRALPPGGWLLEEIAGTPQDSRTPRLEPCLCCETPDSAERSPATPSHEKAQPS